LGNEGTAGGVGGGMTGELNGNPVMVRLPLCALSDKLLARVLGSATPGEKDTPSPLLLPCWSCCTTVGGVVVAGLIVAELEDVCAPDPCEEVVLGLLDPAVTAVRNIGPVVGITTES